MLSRNGLAIARAGAVALTLLAGVGRAARADIIDQGVAINRTLSLTQLQADPNNRYCGIMTEPAAVDIGEYMNLTIAGMQWDAPSVGLFRFTEPPGEPNGQQGSTSDLVYFFNEPVGARVIFLSDDELGRLPTIPGVNIPPPSALPLLGTSADESPIFRTLTANGGTVSLFAQMWSDPFLPAPWVGPQFSDVFYLTVPTPATAAAGLAGGLLLLRRRRG
ncbi:MAG: hypothetical protein IBJ11_05310 [Phycisphaerales bacterium]|nr:hypothetical protein [Phycisphaerales bacterium]